MALLRQKKSKLSIPSYNSNGATKEKVPQFEELPSLNQNGQQEPNMDDFQDMESVKQMATSGPRRQTRPDFDIPVRHTPTKSMDSHQDHYASGSKPLFVKIEDYKKAIELIDTIKEKIRASENTLAMLEKVRSQENTEFEQWHNNIEKIKDKLVLIDRILSGY